MCGYLIAYLIAIGKIAVKSRKAKTQITKLQEKASAVMIKQNPVQQVLIRALFILPLCTSTDFTYS